MMPSAVRSPSPHQPVEAVFGATAGEEVKMPYWPRPTSVTLGSTPACKETRGVVSLPYFDFFQGFLTAKGKEKRPQIGVP